MRRAPNLVCLLTVTALSLVAVSCSSSSSAPTAKVDIKAFCSIRSIFDVPQGQDQLKSTKQHFQAATVKIDALAKNPPTEIKDDLEAVRVWFDDLNARVQVAQTPEAINAAIVLDPKVQEALMDLDRFANKNCKGTSS
jgi:hypothetical protein